MGDMICVVCSKGVYNTAQSECLPVSRLAFIMKATIKETLPYDVTSLTDTQKDVITLEPIWFPHCPAWR